MGRRVRSDDQEGSTTIWMLGVAVIVLVLGGIGLDLWGAVSDRARLVGLADAAAVAGATAVDQSAVRRGEGAVVIDPARARERVAEHLAGQDDRQLLTGTVVEVVGDQVRVQLSARIEVTLLRVLVAGEGMDVTVEGTARAVQAAPIP